MASSSDLAWKRASASAGVMLAIDGEQAAGEVIYLAIRGHEKTARTGRGWLTAVNQFAIMFEDRFKPIGG